MCKSAAELNAGGSSGSWPPERRADDELAWGSLQIDGLRARLMRQSDKQNASSRRKEISILKAQSSVAPARDARTSSGLDSGVSIASRAGWPNNAGLALPRLAMAAVAQQ